MRVTKKTKDEMIRVLSEVYADAKPALVFRTPFELLPVCAMYRPTGQYRYEAALCQGGYGGSDCEDGAFEAGARDP